MTKKDILIKIQKIVGNIDLDLIVSISSQDGKDKYVFKSTGGKDHLEKVLSDLENGYKFYTF